jgi:hypothetical protein
MIFKINNKKLFAGAVSLLFLFVLIMPVLTNAALVNCGIADAKGVITNPCDFTDFIGLINGIIKWIISMAGVIFTLMAVYGGFLYMTSGGDGAKKTKARSILWSTIIGFVIILCAWLIVFTLLNMLIPDDKKFIFEFIGGRK